MSKFTTIILNEMSAVLSQIDERNTSKFVTEIRRAKRIYITGVGRSGLVVKTFGQRLMHLGFDVHLADEITAPAIARGDILIACSGTGTTMLPLEMARKAAIVKARVVSLTATPHSPLAKYSKLVITIPAPLEIYSRKKIHLQTGETPQHGKFLTGSACSLLREGMLIRSGCPDGVKVAAENGYRFFYFEYGA